MPLNFFLLRASCSGLNENDSHGLIGSGIIGWCGFIEVDTVLLEDVTRSGF